MLFRSTAKDAAEYARKLAEEANQAKSLFLSSMSHELRTPMNAILGFSQLLRLGKLEPGQVGPVEQILKSGNHLLELINQVLDLSRIDTGNISVSIENVRARDVVTQCLDMARTLGDRAGIEIVDKTEGKELPLLFVDNTRLIQSLLNLLSNAVKYNRAQGKVTFDAEPVGSMLRFTVSDEGRGIAPDMHEKLFEPFNRLGAEASNVEGTGIGLTITKQLVELMGGHIGFDSAADQGTSFWIEVPLSTSTVEGMEDWHEQAKALPSHMTAPRQGGACMQILYVEDNQANADLMDAIFDELPNFQLISVRTAEDGLKRLDSALPDLVLMDIDLPGMNGDEALKIIRERKHTRDLPVIAVSADVMPASIDAALRIGFNDYITKPFDIVRVVQAIEQAVQ